MVATSKQNRSNEGTNLGDDVEGEGKVGLAMLAAVELALEANHKKPPHPTSLLPSFPIAALRYLARRSVSAAKTSYASSTQQMPIE